MVEEDLSPGGGRRKRAVRQSFRGKKKGTGAAGRCPELEPSLLLTLWHALSLASKISSDHRAEIPRSSLCVTLP